MKKRVLTAMIVVLTLAIVLGSAPLAFAQEPTRPGVLRGQVTAVSDDGFTLKTLRGQTVTVVVTDDTRYRIPGVEDPSLADVKVGMAVLVKGTWRDDETFTAQGVGAAEREQIRRHIIQGKVTAVDSDAGTLTVNTRRGEWTVHTTDDTRYRIPGVENPTLADVKVGDRVLVAGRPDKDGKNTGTARLIVVLPKDMVKGQGRVTAVEGNRLAVETWAGSAAVVTDQATRYRARDIQEPSLDDIQVGDAIFVIGVKQADGTVLAKVIGIRGQPEQSGQ
jgi:hypothetical protein